MVPEFRNEPLTDFSRPAEREAFAAALAGARAERGREWPLVIDGQPVWTAAWIDSHDPCEKDQLVGRVARASRAEADRALDAAERAAHDWARLPAAARAGVLLRAAALLRRRKHDFSATMVYEIGKTWPEADADTAEAIDFLEFYAREACRLAAEQPLTRVAGTDNELVYLPLGVGVVIPPWNFPLAIACGMAAAPIAAGNTVILKPASLTPVVAAKLVDLLHEAGLSPGVVSFLPGSGGEVGEYLVAHPRIRFVSFTGSREVGCRIYELAAKVQPGQRWLKRVVAEMGGKDPIVVDESADLDEAAAGVVASAYSFQGQKCSACSRLIAVQSVYRAVTERVIERARALRVGAAADPASQVAALASADQFAKVQGYVEIGRQEGHLALGGRPGDPQGYYLEPTVFCDVPPSARIFREEIFGPVLACTSALDFEEAIRLANDSDYGLTGSVYARDPGRLAYARRELHVGNLYINRKCTGALVGVEPFGGFGMSGTSAKAGGRDYLPLFTQAKAISERLA
ncbi:MAG: L-glutamate gamma-semialdehyde dehydrogenase [Chloroflexi bacterium]|nr:L-glutamate gamma-semialdehyde dehydrogenase [Chloroflexota bacterium]